MTFKQILLHLNKPKDEINVLFSRYIFVADWNANASRILRASLSGSDVIPIVDTKIVKPIGLAIDHANKHLYWADMDLNTVERIDFDGNNNSRRIIAIGMKV